MAPPQVLLLLDKALLLQISSFTMQISLHREPEDRLLTISSSASVG